MVVVGEMVDQFTSKRTKKFMTLVQFFQIVHSKQRMVKMPEKIFKMEKMEKIFL